MPEQISKEIVRQTFYQLLQNIFNYPGNRLLAVLEDKTFISSLGLMMEQLDLPLDKLEKLEIIIEEQLKNPEDFIEILSVEYTRLFINAYPKVVAAPYARVYMEDEKEVKKDPEFYWRKIGINLSPEWKEMPDHIVAELGFMSYLTSCSDEKRERQYEEVTKSFLKEHMAHWVPKFFGKVAEESNSNFYRVVAAIALEFINSEIRYVEAA